ncbi:SCO family protein [Compostibacter hankyongensis]|uniref:Thioredoxin domain-containing protein n=1 Tax=Compostibacter hankyongensis TaxID=1007089 RepID=A0ABP8FEF4_9BACT
MNRKITILIVFFVVLAGAFFLFLFRGTDYAKKSLPVLGNPGHKVGAFTFVNQEGDSITEKKLDGKVSVVEYFFTTCTGICPKMNRNMDQVYEKFKHTPGFQILSFTVDPAHDSVPVLAKYGEQWGADPRVWLFLTGDRNALFKVAVNQFLLSAADSAGATEQFVHTQFFALVDQDRRIRGFYDGLKQEQVSQLSDDIRALLQEEKKD